MGGKPYEPPPHAASSPLQVGLLAATLRPPLNLEFPWLTLHPSLSSSRARARFTTSQLGPAVNCHMLVVFYYILSLINSRLVLYTPYPSLDIEGVRRIYLFLNRYRSNPKRRAGYIYIYILGIFPAWAPFAKSFLGRTSP